MPTSESTPDQRSDRCARYIQVGPTRAHMTTLRWALVPEAAASRRLHTAHASAADGARVADEALCQLP